MRVFQFHSFYRTYLDYFNRKYPEAALASYEQRLGLILGQRFQATHILTPPEAQTAEFRFTVANDPLLQHRWAQEKSFPRRDFISILRAQIEDHRAEVIYALDPLTYSSAFVRSLPGCVKKCVCWLGSPSFGADLSGYDARLSNFPMILAAWQAQGLRSAWFSPAHDPAMQHYADYRGRPIDIAFVGQYSHLHTRRNNLLATIAALADRYFISYRLMAPKWKRLANQRLLHRISLPVHYLPEQVRRVSGPPVFGVDMYELFGQSKVVFNAAIDMSEQFRGNMRCFEALGCGACMVSDEGIYPEPLTPGVHFVTYRDAADAVAKVETILRAADQGKTMADRGRQAIETTFSKARQWEAFEQLIADL